MPDRTVGISQKFGIIKSPPAAHMKCLNLVGDRKAVLDVGCATGYLSQELRKRGCYVIGVEKDQGRAKVAQGYCDKVIIGDAEIIEIPYNDYFDVVLLADVLQFFKSPKKVLLKFRNYIKKGGYIVLSVPNIANWSIRLSLLFGNFDYQATGILDVGHLRFFTLKTIKELLKQSGFIIESFDITTNLRGATRFGFIRFITRLNKNLFAYQFIIKAMVDRN